MSCRVYDNKCLYGFLPRFDGALGSGASGLEFTLLSM